MVSILLLWWWVPSVIEGTVFRASHRYGGLKLFSDFACDPRKFSQFVVDDFKRSPMSY